jgi:hypothetical protein
MMEVIFNELLRHQDTRFWALLLASLYVAGVLAWRWKSWCRFWTIGGEPTDDELVQGEDS